MGYRLDLKRGCPFSMKGVHGNEEATFLAKKGFIVEGEEVYIWKPSRVCDILSYVSGLKGIDSSAIRLYTMATREGDPIKLDPRGFDSEGDYIINYPYYMWPQELFVTVKVSACQESQPVLKFMYSPLPERQSLENE